MTLWVILHIWWCVYGTAISLRDVLLAASRPLASSIVAGGLALAVPLICGPFVSPLPRLALETAVLLVTFFGVLLFAADRATVPELLRGLKGLHPLNGRLGLALSAEHLVLRSALTRRLHLRW